MRADFKILLLADIHTDVSDKQKELHCQLIIQSCIETIKKGVDYIVMLGDISNMGNADGNWFIKELLRQISAEDKPFPKENIILIPGNHDLSRDVVTDGGVAFNYKQNNKDKSTLVKDIFLNPTKPHSNEKLMRKSNKDIKEFIDKLSTESLITLGKTYFGNYVKAYNNIDKKKTSNPFFGHHFIADKKLCFIRLNSCWNSLFSDTDNGKIIIGRSIIEGLILNIKNDLKKHNLSKEEVTFITIVHHPPGWWAYEELYSTNDDIVTTYDRVFEYTDILFCGHTHGIYTGFSILHNEDSGKSYKSPTLFFESPAIITQSPLEYYPSCLSLFHFHKNHFKIARTNYVYTTANNTFEEKPPLVIDVPKYNIQPYDLNRPQLDKINFNDCNDAAIAAILKSPKTKRDFFRKIILKESHTPIKDKDLKTINKYLVENENYWKCEIIFTKQFNRADIVSMLVSQLEHFYTNIPREGKLHFLICYRYRVVTDGTGNYLDFEQEMYNLVEWANYEVQKKIKKKFAVKRTFLYLYHI